MKKKEKLGFSKNIQFSIKTIKNQGIDLFAEGVYNRISLGRKEKFLEVVCMTAKDLLFGQFRKVKIVPPNPSPGNVEKPRGFRIGAGF